MQRIGSFTMQTATICQSCFAQMTVLSFPIMNLPILAFSTQNKGVQDGTERILPFTEYESDMVSTWNLEKKAYLDSLLDAFEDEDEQEDELPF